MINGMISELGAEKISKEFGVSLPAVYKYGEDPDQSGKDIPVKHLFSLIALAADEKSNQTLQAILDELLNYFANPARRRVVREEGIRELELALSALKHANGKSPQIERCPDCFGPMRLEGKTSSGILIYRCITCGGMGKDAVI